MGRLAVVAFALGALLVSATGCQATRTHGDVLGTKSDGDARVYNNVDTGTAWRLAIKALENSGFSEIQEHREQMAISAAREMSTESSATLAAAWIEDAGSGASRVTFSTSRELAAAIRSPVSPAELHVRFAGLVQMEGK